MSRLKPSPQQVLATRPDQSSWVAANAGAGKTAVLTNRVARLLLAGAAPERILCLTYTKAAAAEMQARLFRMLGGWAMEQDHTLGQHLGDLAATDPVTDPKVLADARRLFARALETPGGLKIQTIHAFCERLLRRFPLEAGVSPRFEVMDDRQTDLSLNDLRARLAADAEAGLNNAFDRAAARLNEDMIDQLSMAALTERQYLQDTEAPVALAARYGLSANASPQDLALQALEELKVDEYASLAEVLGRSGGKAEQSLAQLMANWHALLVQPLEMAARVTGHLLTSKDERPQRGLGTKAVLAERPQADAEFDRLCAWAADLRDQIRRAKTLLRTQDFYAFGGAVVSGLERQKNARSLLDFADLVTKARELLRQRDMRSWVLFKLDQGIDHILVDEAQDTSPEQWDVISAIAEEFIAGEGARSDLRSLFVVGDEKQSIYSFQGAEPRAFGRMRDTFDEAFAQLGTPLGKPRLETSYRSAPAVLEFVDAVFEGDLGRSLTSDGDPVSHLAHREGVRGRVDLWPLVQPQEAEHDVDWWEPVDAPVPLHPKVRLADMVASHIQQIIGSETLPPRGTRPSRPVKAGDIIVLLAGRKPFAPMIIQGLKARGIEVAGADRLSLVQEIAVQDLMALMRVATMPSDDLSLAALLRSPLCGISEDALFDLAHPRDGTLWRALEVNEDHRVLADFLADMARLADFERPYEFLQRVLIHHGGRQKLIARLGAEAEDPIDELLIQSLVFEAHGTPSMAGFLAWLEAGEITVKREMDRADGAVRVMTVHGAKGLEAPVVILPDTVTAGPAGAGRPVILPVEAEGNFPEARVWAGKRQEDDRVTRAARDKADARAHSERQRLLYVALTRAEDWLILCGAHSDRSKPESWYNSLELGMDRLAERRRTISELPSPTGEGTMRRFETGSLGSSAHADHSEHADVVVSRPDWLKPAIREPRVERGSPSGLGDGLVQHAGGSTLDPQTARRRGSAIHLLMERLPQHPQTAWQDMGERLLSQGFADLDGVVRAGAVQEALAALTVPTVQEILAQDFFSEVSVTMDPPYGGQRMIGRVDCLAVTDHVVTVVDYKTDGTPPGTSDAVPHAYLAQLGAYAAAVSPAWPGREVRLAILWTAVPKLMGVPSDVADTAFRAASFARTGRA